MLLEELCNLDGVSSGEEDVREFIKDKIKKYADEITIDSMGNMIALKKGKKSDKRIMLSAHMDEVGFIVSEITDKGFLKFKTVGGIDEKVVISKRVRVGKNKIPGIIGMKAIHLQTKEERDAVPKMKALYIDIGAESKKEAEKLVELGDLVAFDTKTTEFGEDKIKGKAIDDRVGCAVLMDLIKKNVIYDTYFCFLVQEEVGLRGARIVAAKIEPDLALVFEATTCLDVYGTKESEYVTELGKGVSVTMMDASTIVLQDFRNKLIKLAEDNKIPCQYKRTTRGGNDAGAIHLSGKGVKTAALSVPARYIHSPVSVVSKKDIEAMNKLGEKFLENIEAFIQERI